MTQCLRRFTRCSGPTREIFIMKRILMVVSSNDRLGSDGEITGAWMEELAASYYVFVDAGCNVTLSSPKGGAAPIDPLSMQEPWLTENGERFNSDDKANYKLNNTSALNTVDARRFDAVYLVGGVATVWDFPNNKTLADIVGTLYALDCPVAGVCHGVLGLTDAMTSDGESIVAGKNVTGVSNAEEVMTGFDKLVPVLPEDRLTELGGTYSCAEPLQENVVVDGNVLTGQNPASAGPLAGAVLTLLSK